MKIRRFQFFAEKEDLQMLFRELQEKEELYYVPTYADARDIAFDDIMSIENLGINFHGSHIGNMQMLIFKKAAECLWRAYTCTGNSGQTVTKYTALDAGNSAYIEIDLSGIYQEIAIFPSTVSTMYYDIEAVKKLYEAIRKIVRKRTVKAINGFSICRKAYEYKDRYRFCTIDIKSPHEYDLKVE